MELLFKYTDNSWIQKKILLGAMLVIVAAALGKGPTTFEFSLAQVDDVPGSMDEDIDGAGVPSNTGKDIIDGYDNDTDRNADDISDLVSQLGSLEDEASTND